MLIEVDKKVNISLSQNISFRILKKKKNNTPLSPFCRPKFMPLG